MIIPFIFGSLTSFVMGLALLLQWRKYPRTLFTRDIGLVFLGLAIAPLALLLYWGSSELGKWVALALTLLVVVACLSFLVLGIVHLAGREFSRRNTSTVIAAFALLLAMALGNHDWQLASGICGVSFLICGGLAMRWMGLGQRSEQWVGPMLMLMGLAQFILLLPISSALALQVSVNALLRLVLGLLLIQADLGRFNEQAQASSERYERLTTNSPQGVAVAHADRIVYCNRAFLRIYGIDRPEEITAQWINAGIPEEELHHVMELRRQVLQGQLPLARFEGPRQRRDGSPLHLQFTIWQTEWEGHPALQTVVSDETEFHQQMAQMLYRATHDELTGLPNRAALLNRLRERCQTQERFGLLLLDIDRFKLFNDAQGHSLGDEILKALTEILRHGLNGPVELSRLGSDDFALLTPLGWDSSQTMALAQQVRDLLAWPLVLPEKEFFVDASIGVALYPLIATDAESMLRAANAAMHEAKKIAGTSIVLAEPRFAQGSSEVLQQEQALRSGILKREFSLAYQPKVDAATDRLTGFEALARWEREGVGAVSPVQFIAAAERTGLIGALGMLLLSKACEQLVAWRTEGLELSPVAVNVSALQLLDPGFPQLVVQVLHRHGIEPHLISLEITESAAIDNMEQAREQLLQLRELGLHVAMDDFGTGFSSLHMLRHLPLHSVKIDRSLIIGMPTPDAVAVVQAICQLAGVLGLKVVAEGVETEAQSLAAHQAGCHEIQGYFHARPLAPDQVRHWLLAGRRPEPVTTAAQAA